MLACQSCIPRGISILGKGTEKKGGVWAFGLGVGLLAPPAWLLQHLAAPSCHRHLHPAEGVVPKVGETLWPVLPWVNLPATCARVFGFVVFLPVQLSSLGSTIRLWTRGLREEVAAENPCWNQQCKELGKHPVECCLESREG